MLDFWGVIFLFSANAKIFLSRLHGIVVFSCFFAIKILSILVGDIYQTQMRNGNGIFTYVYIAHSYGKYSTRRDGNPLGKSSKRRWMPTSKTLLE